MSTEVKKSVERAKVEQHEWLAGNAFKDHVLTVLRDEGPNGIRHYECGKPGTGAYRFQVLLWPGRMLVVGDIGECLWQRTHDMLTWSRSAVNSIDYFAEKVPHSIETEEYDADKAREVIDEFLANYEDCYGDPISDDLRETVLEVRELADESHRFPTALYDSGVFDGCDFPNLKTWNSNFLWCRECVKWLLAHLPLSA